jgi:predicted RNase H-like HicB family nuclease
MLKYSVTIQYDEKEDIFVASVPELEGCMAHGSTQEQAIKEISIAMRLWLESAKENGDVIPEPQMYKVSLLPQDYAVSN